MKTKPEAEIRSESLKKVSKCKHSAHQQKVRAINGGR